MSTSPRDSPHSTAQPRYRCIALALCLLPCAVRTAPSDEPFTRWLEADQRAFKEYSEKVTLEYERFEKEEMRAFEEFVRRAGAKWGTNNVWAPERKVWVQYADDFEERSSVDFKKGLVSVQILLGEDADPHAEWVQKRMAAAIEEVVLSGTTDPIQMVKLPHTGTSAHTGSRNDMTYVVRKGDTLWGLSRRFKVSRQAIARRNGISADAWLTIGQKLIIPGKTLPRTPVPKPRAPRQKPRGRPVPTRSVQPLPEKRPAPVPKRKRREPSANPILEGQIRLADGTPVSHENANRFARSLLAATARRTRRITGADTGNRNALTVTFKLAPDHLDVRARRYVPFVTEYATRYDIEPALVLAVIHTESSFNPRARSAVPAYGLMQLVPRSGARDAYRLVHGEDKLVGPTYLYKPRANIELGTAYLHILKNRYLKAVEDPLSRRYCVVAAYNTGAGNVSRAFIDSTSARRAAAVVNLMAPEDVYLHLRTNLPHHETREYVKKVRERIPLYQTMR